MRHARCVRYIGWEPSFRLHDAAAAAWRQMQQPRCWLCVCVDNRRAVWVLLSDPPRSACTHHDLITRWLHSLTSGATLQCCSMTSRLTIWWRWIERYSPVNIVLMASFRLYANCAQPDRQSGGVMTCCRHVTSSVQPATSVNPVSAIVASVGGGSALGSSRGTL